MIDQIRPSQFSDWVKENSSASQTVLLIDVREAWEFETAHIKAEGFDVMHLPMQTVPEHLNSLDTQRPIACLCHHGSRSQHIANFLQQNGFKTVVNISGGIHAWSTEADSSIPTY
jgi:rhodanese-related sulfurtransferase